MAFDDAFASGQDLLRDSLLSQYQPDDGQPDSINPKVLTDRLARKLALRTTQDAEVDFNVAPEKDEKEPDLSAFGTPVEPKETPEPSEEDLSRFGTPVEVKGPAQKPLTIARQAAAAAKGIPHGAIAGVGDALKGAGAVYDNGTPAQDETPQYDAMGNPTGMVNAPTAAVPAKPLQDRTLYKAGKSVDDFAQSVAPMTQQEKESAPGRIGLGVGGLVPLVAAGVAGGAVAAPFGAIAATIGSLAPAAGAMALDTYGSVFEAAKTAGKSDEEANSSAGKSALVAGVLGSLPLGAGKYAKSLIAKMAVSSLAFTTLGEAQEAILQQIAKDYDPKAGYSLEAKRLIAELVLGAGMGGLHHAFERKPAPPPPGAAPGAAPGPTPTGIPPGTGTPPPGAGPGAGPNPGAGYGPNGRANPNGWPGGTGSWGQAPGGGAGSNPGAGPRPGPGPGAGNASSAGTSSGPPPGTGQGKAGGFTFHPGADFTMGQGQRATAEREYQRTVGGDPSGMGDPELFEALKRAKMERLYRTFEGGKDPSGLADHELFNAVNDHLRDTSNTGHTAKPETPEEAAAREATAKDRDERDILKKAGWTDAHVNAMTPEQRAEYIARATGKGPKAAPETPGSTTQEPPTQPSAQNEPGVAEKAAKSASPNASSGSSQNQSSPDEAAGPEVVKNRASNPEAEIYKGRREAPIVATTADDVLQAQPNEPKSPEQAKAENFQHAHVELPQFGLTGKNSISIETGVGQVRKGEDADGTPWSVTMEHGAYGRIKGTKGADGRELDIMVGPHPASPHIFVIDQHDPNTGEFDEHKIYAGYRTPIDALHAYAHAYDDHGENRVGYVTAMGPEEFDAWRKGDTTKALKPVGEKTADSEAHHNLEPASEQNQPAGRGGTAQSGNAATAQTAAGNDRSQENGKKSKKVAGSAEPQNLLQFLASKGGLKPHPELEVMDAHKHVVEMSSFPYKRKLVREGGMDLDTAREAAEEMGYFRGTHDGTSTIADFLDAIDNGVNRKQHLYPEGFEGHQTKHEATAEAERGAHEDEQVQEFLDQLHATGHGEIGPELRARAVHLMAIDGLDADTAIDTALIQLDTEESEQREQIRATIGKDNYDEAHAATAPQDGGDHAHGVEGGAGREETPTAKPGARAPAESEATGADQGNDTGRSGSAGGKSDTGGAAADQAAPRSAESPSETGDAVGPNADTVETLKQQLIKISSGMSRPRDLKVGGWAVGDNPNRGVGVDVGELSTPALDQVARTVIDHKAKLFVDSGAFSVFRRNIRDQAAADKEAMSLFGKAKPAQWKSLDFDAIMAKYDLLLERIAEHNKAEETDYFRPMLVMPDIVGDQAASLALVKRYKGAISTDTEFNISQPVVPIQRGALSLADAYAQIVKTLGTDKFIVGIPSNEKAVPLAELKAFLAAAQPKRIHFLGAIAEKNLDPKLQVIADLGLKLDHLSADANILRSKLYGRQNYKTRAEGIADILGDEAAQPEPEATPAQIGEFIQHIESEIAAGRTDADISPTRSLKDFQAAAEARGWTYGAYGKGKALWSPDRSHVIFASVSVEGNHVTAQWAKPSEGITPPGGKALGPFEVTSPDQIDHAKPLVLGKVYRGTEAGNQDARLRVTMNGDLGRGVYITQHEKLAASYGGGPKARVSDGTRVVHSFDITKPIAPKDYAYAFASSTGGTVKIVRGNGETIFDGKWTAGKVKDDDSPMGVAIRESGVKVVVGATGGFLHNQTVVLDKSILEPTTETGADNKQQTVLPGAEKIGQGEQAQRKADEKLKPKVNQKPADVGLFGDEKDQTDLLDMVAKKPAAPKDAFDDIFDSAIDAEFGAKPKMNIDDVAKGLGALFGKSLKESEPPFLDEAKYKAALPFFKAGLEHFAAGAADLTTMVRALVRHLSVAGMDADAIRAMKPYIKRFTDDVTAGRETINAPSRSDVLESGGGKPAPENGLGKADVSAAAAATGPGTGERGSEADAADQRSATGGGVSQDHAPIVGERGNLELPAREPDVEDRNASDRERERSDERGEEGFSFDNGTTDEAVRNAQKDADLNGRRGRQQEADRRHIPFKWGRIDNIADSLPMLFPEQHQDVQTAELRFNKTEGHGMLFTNGTGTGKTYSGLGVIKRFFQQGKGNVLVVAPSQGILTDWVKSAKDLGLEMNVLGDTQDKGRGLSATTYANLGANRTLADREWDLVVTDEAHKLSSDQDGTKTEALRTLRALTLHPDGLYDRAKMQLRALWDQIEKLPESQRKSAYEAFDKKAQPLIEKWKDQQRPKTLMMSATPFAYHFSLDYAEGYLFDFDRSDDTKGGYNRGDGRDKFYMQHLGYRMRTNKLTKPDADVRSEVMERQLHEYLKKTGSLSGRALTVDKDYDRKFVLAHNAIGTQIDQALNFLQEAEDGKYRPIYDLVSKKFDYLTRMRLLEAIKADASIDFINQSLALGRKVVVFHDYNEGGGINPFELTIDPSQETSVYQGGKQVMVKPAELYNEFRAQNPYVGDLKFSDYPPPISTLTRAFPKAMVYNGTVSNKARNETKRLFNDDNSGRDIIIVQSAAGEAGISLHDTTGKKQRVLLNLGMPVRPTTSIQQEGRIYRVGQASDAIFRYMNTGTDWERWTFAGKIADRAGTAENLALGDQARTIRQSYVDAFDNAGDYAPEPGEGKGGKEADRATSHSVSEFDKAKTHYFANSKTSGKRDQREGTDYFATPEPIGLKMVEFADIKPGEKILEPSAGHGAISRYFPEDSARTLVEPSSSLASRAALTSPGARVVVDRFENLDKGANKFDAIVMNPPFGSGGSTAVEHLAKAAGHLKNGGRIVALIPRGPAADAKLEKFTVSEAAKGLYLVGDIELPSVTFTRAGTGARTHIVVFEKQTDPDVAQKLSYQKNRDYSDEETISALFDRIEHTDMGQRLEPKTKDADIPTTGKVTVGGVGFSLESSSDRMRHSAILTSFVGSRFREITRAAEDAGGEYVKSAKAYRFKSVEDRQKFLDAVANPEAAPEREAPSAPSGVTFKTGETIHAKTGGKLFVATANERLDRDAYGQMSAVAKTHGGYYSSFKGNGAIPGFQFKSKEDRQFFLDAMKRGAGFAESESPFAGLSKPPSSPMQRANPASRQLGAEGQAWTLDNGRATGVEHLIAYDAQGKEVDRAIGAVDSVDISPELEAAMMDPRQQIVVHHNHPSNNTLSRDDIVTLAMPGLKAVYAHGHAGNVFRAELTPQFKALGLTPDTMARLLDQLHQAVEQVVKAKVVEAVESFRISGDQANTAYWHLVNQTLHDGGIIDYQTNFELGDLVSHIPGLADMMDRAVAIMKKDVAAKIGAKGERAVRDQNDRRAGAVRHPGDLGTVFDRASLAKPVVSTKVGDRQRAENNSGEAGEGKQLKLSSPDDLFKPPAPGSFDKSINDILRKRLLGRLGDLNATEYRTQLQDKFIRVKKAEESVSAPSDQSAYQAESLYYGRTGQRLESLTDHHIDPLIREMKARDIDVNSFDEFLSARHAPERNNKIGAMYPKGHEFNDAMADHSKVGGSGWSTEEALKVIRAIKAKGKLADYLAVAKMVDALNYKTRRTLLDAGLIDRDTFDQWNAAYKYYVPLRGIADGFEHEESLSRQGSGMNIRGKEAQTAFGRKSKSASPLAYSIMQAEMAVVRAEKNKVGNTFLKFVRANPDPDRWTVNRRDAIRRIDKDTGLVTTMPDNISAQKDNEFATKVDGKNTIITLNGPDGLNLARALKNMGTANVHALIRVYSTLTHTMAKLATSFNPDFMIPNLARDLGEAFINLQAQQQRSFVRKFIGHIPGAMKGSMLALAGKGAGNRYVDAFHRFDKAGGRVRFFGIDDPDQIETTVNRKLKRLQGGALNTIKDFGDSAGKALEVAGGGIENATRLAAFMAAEEVGMSTPDSAMLGRNLTVDFNKKGELGGAISGLYMFANAGIQGQARMARALGHRRVWKAVGALAAAAALSTLYSILNSDTDEAGVTDYMKVPPWERDKNLVFMIGDHNYLKIPLPYGFAPFAVIGSHAVSVLMGHEKPGKAASAIIDSIISAFNPLGDESSLLMDIIPSAIRPAFHITFNKNWTDKPLYPEGDKNRGLRPDSTQSFRNDSAFSKEVAKQLNSWSGGNAYHPGAIDVHPGTIDHVLQALGGGLGRFLKSIADTAYNTINGEEWHPDKTPILRRFVGKVGEEADRALYYEKRQEALDDKAGINQARKDLKTPDREGAKEFLEGNGSAAGRRVEIFKSADAKMKGLRQREDQINNSDQSTEVKRDELTAIRNKMRAVQNEARARVQKLQAN